jgi:hypothetical protein
MLHKQANFHFSCNEPLTGLTITKLPIPTCYQRIGRNLFFDATEECC